MNVEHRQPIEPCLAHATGRISLEESQAADGALALNHCDELCTSDLHDLPDVEEEVCINGLENFEWCMKFHGGCAILRAMPFHPPAVELSV